MAPSAPRVVLLTKDNHIGRYLEARLAATGHLAAVVHEVRLADRREKIKYAWKFAKKEGFARTLDVMLYEAFEALFRKHELRRATETVLPIPERRSAPGYPRHTVRSLNAPESRELIASLRPDVFVVHATGILSPKTYELASTLAMNIHCGVLPEYRGHASTFWALWNRDVGNVGVSVHEVARVVDTGRVLRLGRVDVGPDDTDITAWLRAVKAGADLTIDVVQRLARGEEPGAATLEGETGPHYPRRGLTDYVGYKLGRRPRVRRAAQSAERRAQSGR